MQINPGALEMMRSGKGVPSVSTHGSQPGDKQTQAAEKPTIQSKFKDALMQRFEHSQKGGTAAGKTKEDAAALVDSIANTVSKVKDSFGEEAGNAAMNKILKTIDEKGFSQEVITGAMSEAVRTASLNAPAHKKAGFMKSLNEDLGVDLAKGNQSKAKSLSRAINDFFGAEPQASSHAEDKAKVMGFDDQGNWRELEINVEENREAQFLKGTPEAAKEALENTAKFTMEDIGSDTVADMANFLRTEMGNEAAASLLENQPKGADFMATVDMAINEALKNSPDRQADAAKLEGYLNGTVKSAINNSAKTNKNLFGDIEFKGWSLQSGAPTETGKEGEVIFSSQWGYTNRSDVSYTRDNRVKSAAEQEAEAKAKAEESPLTQQIKKLTAAPAGDIGNLVDEEV